MRPTSSSQTLVTAVPITPAKVAYLAPRDEALQYRGFVQLPGGSWMLDPAPLVNGRSPLEIARARSVPASSCGANSAKPLMPTETVPPETTPPETTPPGNLDLSCSGEGSPTVVLASGLGTPSGVFLSLQYWFPDAGGIAGAAASSAVAVTVP